MFNTILLFNTILFQHGRGVGSTAGRGGVARRLWRGALLALTCCALGGLVSEETAQALSPPGSTGAVSSVRGYWQFNGDTLDSSTWGNHGVIRFARYPSGKSGQCISLTGRSAVTVSASDSLQVERGFSVALWTKIGEWGQTATLIASGDPAQARVNWQVGMHDGLLEVSFRGQDGSTGGLSVPETLIPLNTWVNVSAWYSADAREVGLVLYGQSLITSEIRNDASGVLVRNEPLGFVLGQGLKGSLDEVRFEAPWE